MLLDSKWSHLLPAQPTAASAFRPGITPAQQATRKPVTVADVNSRETFSWMPPGNQLCCGLYPKEKAGVTRRARRRGRRAAPDSARGGEAAARRQEAQTSSAQSARSTGAGSVPGAGLPTRDGSARGTGTKGQPRSSTGRSAAGFLPDSQLAARWAKKRQIPAQSPPEALGPTGAPLSRPRPVVRHHSLQVRGHLSLTCAGRTCCYSLAPTRGRTAHRSPASSLP